MKLLSLVFSGIAIAIAGVMLWKRDFDSAFIVAALGLVAWFLNYRMQMKEVTKALDRQDSEGTDFEDENEN